MKKTYIECLQELRYTLYESEVPNEVLFKIALILDELETYLEKEREEA